RSDRVAAYVSDSSRMTRAQQMTKALAEEKALYDARVKDAKGNADALEKLAEAHQVALAGIRERYKDKDAAKALEKRLNDERKAIEQFEQARKKEIAGQYSEIAAIQAKAEKVEDEIAVYG